MSESFDADMFSVVIVTKASVAQATKSGQPAEMLMRPTDGVCGLNMLFPEYVFESDVEKQYAGAGAT